MSAHGISGIELVVVNLYAFDATVAKGSDFPTCIENIDIGGPSMLRSSAKNHASVAVASSPAQYAGLLATLAETGGATTLALRKALACAAFTHTASYDASISSWFQGQLAAAPAATATGGGSAAPQQPLATVLRSYTPDTPLKYGCNPHQAPAWVGHLTPSASPFTILNGTPGYINFLDAANAWQLVSELAAATGLPAAASFKHCSPAGAAVAVPLTPADCAAYDMEATAPEALTPLATAYLRARQADPMCSYGDFAALSHVVDVATAEILRTEVSDGLVAPGYEPAALEILRKKKGGAFIVLQAQPGYSPPAMEYREVYGMVLAQRRNDATITAAASMSKQVTAGAAFTEEVSGQQQQQQQQSAERARTHSRSHTRSHTAPLTLPPPPSLPLSPPQAKRDLAIALIAIKYTQSNSVGYARDGQMVGVGAGQQSRVDCVKLAGRKVSTWWLRRHPKVLALPFKPEVKRTARVNARVAYIEGDLTPSEQAEWAGNFSAPVEPLSAAEKAEFMAGLRGVSLASDAFFPFRDSLDHAARYGVSYVAQPGGSVQDEEVTRCANEYGMVMCHGVPRLFHH